MSGQTIRDVVIRVSVESGDMSGFDLSGVQSAAKAVQDDLQSMAKSNEEEVAASINATKANMMRTNITASQSSGGGFGGGLWQPPGDNQGYFGGGEHPGIGMPGYGQSVRDRAAAKAADAQDLACKQMKSMGISDDVIEHAIQKTDKSVQSTAMARIREHDSESAAGQRAAEKAKKQEAKRLLDEENAARQQTNMAITQTTAGLAMIGVAIKTSMSYMNNAQSWTSAVHGVEITDVSSRANQKVRDAKAQSKSFADKERTMVDFGKYNVRQHLPENRQREASLREMEARTDITSEQKAENRRLAEQRSGSTQRRGDLLNQSDDVYLRTRVLDKQQSAVESRKEKIVDAFTKKRGVINAKREEIENNPSLPGRVYSSAQMKDMFKLDRQSVEVTKTSGTELKQAEEELLSIGQRRVKLAEQDLSLAEEMLTVTRQQKQDAYVAVKEHKESMRQDAVRIGSKSFGEQARIKMVDEKITRIKEGSGEEMLPWEMEISTREKMGTAEANAQAEKNFKKLGLKNMDRTEEQLKEKESEFNKLEESPQEKDDETRLGNAQAELEKSNESAMSAIDSVLRITELYNKLAAHLERVESEIREMEAQHAFAATGVQPFGI